jgi:hypothetical protein
MKKITAVLCAALLTLSACGNGDDDKAKENIKANILKDDSGTVAGAKPTEKQAGCMADGMVDEVGVEKLQKYKLLDKDLKIIEDADPQDMDEDDADALAGVIVDCVDMGALIQKQIDDSSEADITDEQKSCISDAIDEDTIQDGLSASFQGKTEDNPMMEMQSKMMQCVGAPASQ